MMVRNAGMDSEKSSSSISLMGLSIIKPTMTSAAVVAAEGMWVKMGAKNRAMAKQQTVVKAVRPVRPPAPTPAALST